MSRFDFSADKVLPYVGRMEQVAGIRRAILDDGSSRGIRVADVDNGSGLSFTVLLDRGMDIGNARFKGIPLAWLSPSGFGHPAFYDAAEIGWLRSWGGGLLSGCGLLNVGPPDKDAQFESEGLHGRLSNIPAEKINCESSWQEGHYLISLSGQMRHIRLFGEHLILSRSIATLLGSNVIEITDTVENIGPRPSPLMILYHCNLGWPLVSPKTVIKIVEHEVEARDDEAARGIDRWQYCEIPKADIAEQCYRHYILAGDDGLARCTVANPDIGLNLEIAYRVAELPLLMQWKMMGEKEYVLGIEPTNCHVSGQSAEKADYKNLLELMPGEKREFYLRLSIEEVSEAKLS